MERVNCTTERFSRRLGEKKTTPVHTVVGYKRKTNFIPVTLLVVSILMNITLIASIVSACRA